MVCCGIKTMIKHHFLGVLITRRIGLTLNKIVQKNRDGFLKFALRPFEAIEHWRLDFEILTSNIFGLLRKDRSKM